MKKSAIPLKDGKRGRSAGKVFRTEDPDEKVWEQQVLLPAIPSSIADEDLYPAG